MKFAQFSLLLAFAATFFLWGVNIKPVHAHGKKIDKYFHVYAKLDKRPNAVTVLRGRRVFVAQEVADDKDFRVVEVDKNGALTPFPNAEWASAPAVSESGESGKGMVQVSAIRVGTDGMVWMLDSGSNPKRLIGWHADRDELHKTIDIAADVAPENASLQDMALDPVHKAIFITDAGGAQPALITVDLESGKSRRILQGHQSVIPEDNALTKVDGKTYGPLIGARSITIDPESDFVYFAAMNATRLYRALAIDLLDETISPSERSDKVQDYSDKPVSAGLSIDAMGNIYVADINAGGIGIVSIDTKKYRLFFSASKDHDYLSWPDSLSVGSASRMYVTSPQLHRSKTYTGGEDQSQTPFYLMRFIAVGPLMAGR